MTEQNLQILNDYLHTNPYALPDTLTDAYTYLLKSSRQDTEDISDYYSSYAVINSGNPAVGIIGELMLKTEPYLLNMLSDFDFADLLADYVTLERQYAAEHPEMNFVTLGDHFRSYFEKNSFTELGMKLGEASFSPEERNYADIQDHSTKLSVYSRKNQMYDYLIDQIANMEADILDIHSNLLKVNSKENLAKLMSDLDEYMWKRFTTESGYSNSNRATNEKILKLRGLFQYR